MESLDRSLSWIIENPGAFAWVCFGLLSTLVTVYRANERRIRELAARTETDVDDRLVAVLDWVVAIFDVLRLLVPHGLARPLAQDDEE